jgi:threonine/homoserine/homoserine lactone efflux protein
MYILGRSVSQGRRAGVLSVLGISTGTLGHTLLASLGLSAILARSAMAFDIIKYIGAAYLIYLGIKALLSASDAFSVKEKSQEATMSRIYLQGILTNLLNPKVALFFLAFLPQFVNPSGSFGPLPFLLLGITFVATGTAWCLLIAFFSSLATSRLRENPAISKVMNKLTGLLFIGLGAALLRARTV